MKIMIPGFESMDNSPEFPIVDVVVVFSQGKQLGKVRAGMPVII